MFEAVNSSGVGSMIDLFMALARDIGQVVQRIDFVRFVRLYEGVVDRRSE